MRREERRLEVGNRIRTRTYQTRYRKSIWDDQTKHEVFSLVSDGKDETDCGREQRLDNER